MNDMQQSIAFHKEKCIQCHGCEMACKMWRQTDRGVVWRRVLNIWSGAYPNATCTSLSISCLHCIEPACIEACTTGAISKRDTDGLVLIDRNLCTGCQACLDACPFNVPQFGADGLMQKCDMCLASYCTSDFVNEAPPCVCTCPTGALELTAVAPYKKLETEKVTLELYLKTK